MFLEAIASFASIIGLSMQVMDKYNEQHPEELGPEMAALKALSITGKTWKNVHSKYHVVERNLGTILSAIETINNGKRETLSAERVNAIYLKDAFDDTNWQNFIETMEYELRPSIETLKYANSNAQKKREDVLKGLRNNGLFEVAERVQTIVIAQEKIVETHGEFVSFTQMAGQFIKRGDWGKEQIEYVIGQRALLRTRIPMVIGNTDNALMAILDLYNFVIDEA